MTSSKKKWTIAGASIAALLALAAGAWVYLFGLYDDPALAALQREFDASIARGEGPPEGMRERMDSLPESQRRRFFMRNRETMMQARSGQMTELLNLPPQELRKEISERADRVLAARSRGDSDEGFRGPPGPPGEGRRGGPGGGNWQEMSQSDRMKRVASFTTPEMRGAFSEMKRLVDDELDRRGEPPMEPREMRNVMRPDRT